jgi:hypothetical protein
MFSGRRIKRKELKKMNIVVLAGVLNLLLILAFSACAASEGSIVIVEDGHGSGFSMKFKDFNSENKYELSLNGGDVIQVEVEREGGGIAFSVSGSKGGEPYKGNDMLSGTFTVTVHETDNYSFKIKGKDATGNVTVKIISKEKR